MKQTELHTFSSLMYDIYAKNNDAAFDLFFDSSGLSYELTVILKTHLK